MDSILQSSLFSILVCLAGFELGIWINKKTRFPLFNPLLIAIAFVIGYLLLFHVSYNEFNQGGQFITDLLQPATVVLAVPLYKQIGLLKKHFIPIFSGIFFGSGIGIVYIFFLSYFLKLSPELIKSLMPKSITTPIGMQVSQSLGGVVPVTVVAIIVTGITGAIVYPFIHKLFKIKNPVAVGVSLGTCSHAVGTSKALTLGDTQGAMSSLSIGVAGLSVVVLAPLLYHVLSSLVGLH
ncbi:MAG: LrgB family protein [Sarcina sp.]